MEKIVVLEFMSSMPPYNPGETAGFNQLEADRLLRVPGLCKVRPDIEGKAPPRSPGLDPPAFSLQQMAQVMRAATDPDTSDRPRKG